MRCARSTTRWRSILLNAEAFADAADALAGLGQLAAARSRATTMRLRSIRDVPKRMIAGVPRFRCLGGVRAGAGEHRARAADRAGQSRCAPESRGPASASWAGSGRRVEAFDDVIARSAEPRGRARPCARARCGAGPSPGGVAGASSGRWRSSRAISRCSAQASRNGAILSIARRSDRSIRAGAGDRSRAGRASTNLGASLFRLERFDEAERWRAARCSVSPTWSPRCNAMPPCSHSSAASMKRAAAISAS